MLRHYFEYLNHHVEEEVVFEAYLTKVQIFLSHSEYDEDGERIANAISDWLHSRHGLPRFFDVHDRPTDLRIHKAAFQQVRVSTMVECLHGFRELPHWSINQDFTSRPLL